ncbi:DUF294 nucleotidyltransferase-like domain-containing protein [Neolewinella lacunae]|uniref:Cyclic nucleotide-binding domain-containing protein n=1 Tax=Neolewinella lacunae TaxID=1517758 RepID=A0A923PG52_9BACT|nr:DUF294 nucleotidyltransferase-like domain-containing protein [Neolewinella lacunae]MBC6993452.1 cyclic nucleotide-binding domain-containing protein [Neolewinella lacunae]MDN3636272.1 DUF294 nucleotidyltransferase-like domain-containing protein [Neolewinella lacunae]
MPNQVTRRIYDYLKDIPPFSFVDNEEALMAVAGRVEVRYQPVGTVIFRPGEPPKDRFYLVKEGAIELYHRVEDAESLVERLGEGEVFGIRPLLAEDNYLFEARAVEESLLYAINSAGFRELLPRYPALTQYLATSMAGSGRFALNRPAPVPKLGDDSLQPDLAGLLPIQANRTPITCPATARIVDAARAMSEHNVGSIIITDLRQRPIGIITDRDLRQKVATGLVSNQELVGEIMQGPVACIRPMLSLADVQIEMVRRNINHLVQTEDGTDKTPVTGIISKHDILVVQGNNPAVLIREIGRAKSSAYLRTLRERTEQLLASYLEREVSISFITTVMTKINDEIIRKCIKLGLARVQADGLGNPPALFDWLVLGSQGRGEQLLRTDQDNALIFEDVPQHRYAAVKDYFLQLASYVTEFLNDVGFEYCSGDMMASNPRWCLPVSAWKTQFSQWMHENSAENMLHTSIFFDYRGVWGDGSLPAKLTEHIFQELERSSARFLASLALAALDNPSPLTFFRNFVVERSGEHKDQFDLKSRAMRPLTDAARVLMLEARQGNINNTFRRFEVMAEREPQNAELFRAAAEAYEVLIRLRATMGLRRKDSGRFLKPEELSRVQRLLLRNSFEPVKEIQTLLEVRFQLNFLR